MLKAQAESLIRNLIAAGLLLGFFVLVPRITQTATARINPTPIQPISTAPSVTPLNVVRATLDNGMRVVVIRNPLAPVVTVEQNYLVGGDESPEGFPGMAHVQEHMAFRGCSELTADQISAIFAQLGILSRTSLNIFPPFLRRTSTLPCVSTLPACEV